MSGDPLRELVAIMARLRAPDGCPWDLEQTHASLKPYIIEEAYEVLDAVDAGNPNDLCEELGDLLLQVVFQAQIGTEADTFDIDDVARSINDKLVRRHPHVFDSESMPRDAAEVEVRWERQKAREGRKALAGVPRDLPALLRAVRVTEKASRVGFDWSVSDEVLDKVVEEVGELREAIASGREQEIADELGDLLFSLANFARHIGVEPEGALRATIDRFTTRFEKVEAELERRGSEPGDTPLEELDRLWEEAKSSEE